MIPATIRDALDALGAHGQGTAKAKAMWCKVPADKLPVYEAAFWLAQRARQMRGTAHEASWGADGVAAWWQELQSRLAAAGVPDAGHIATAERIGAWLDRECACGFGGSRLADILAKAAKIRREYSAAIHAAIEDARSAGTKQR